MLNLNNGAEIVQIKLNKRVDRWDGVVLANYHGEFVTWWCSALFDQDGLECFNGHYHRDDIEAAREDFHARF